MYVCMKECEWNKRGHISGLLALILVVIRGGRRSFMRIKEQEVASCRKLRSRNIFSSSFFFFESRRLDLCNNFSSNRKRFPCLHSLIYKIIKIVRAFWLAAGRVCMRVCKHAFIFVSSYIPGFLKTGLAKISTHSTTWQFKTTKLIQRPIKSLYMTPGIPTCPNWKWRKF